MSADGGATLRTRLARHRFWVMVLAGWATMVAVLPTVRPDGPAHTGTGSALGIPVGGPQAGQAATDTPDAPTAVTDTALRNRKDSRAEPIAAPSAIGRTRLGFECHPGLLQIPDSKAAPPCLATFSGPNGGATSVGVTADTIRIADYYVPPDAAGSAQSEINARMGGPTPEEFEHARKVFLDYFNKAFELYGRHVELVTYTARPQSVEDLCRDAAAIHDDLHAFGVLAMGDADFDACAAQRGLIVFHAESTAPADFFTKHHPYLWSTSQDCTRLAYQTAEYIGKQLAGRRARWAGEADYRSRVRKIGVYIADTPLYQPCLKLAVDLLRTRYHLDNVVTFTYRADASRIADQAQEAVRYFKAQGVTSLVLTCDPYSVVFLTNDAATNAWFPEWITAGVGIGVEDDGFARQYNEVEVDGHLFGRLEVPTNDALIGPTSEPQRAYRKLTGADLPPGTDANFYYLVLTFAMLQAAGPALTPDAVGAGAFALPDAASPLALLSFREGPDGTPGAHDHSRIDDNAEGYWDAQATGFDGKKGTFRLVYGGRRFRNGEWPSEEPPVYPGR